ncbi:alpha/beta fold hydrolase [Nocardia salmonicida]|uniref:alpha/beta fold hydrolase n=1 Tax=Nocardia salmonicida TaxID=53431 RepID=UPI0007A402F6
MLPQFATPAPLRRTGEPARERAGRLEHTGQRAVGRAPPRTHDNLLVERFLLRELRNTISDAEADHYRAVQPSPEARHRIAAMPGQILAARPFLDQLATPTLLIRGMKDMAFRPASFLPRMRGTFTDHQVVELPGAGHFVPEHEPGAVAEAIVQRFR